MSVGSTTWEIPAEGTPSEIADHFLVVGGVLFLNRFAEPSTLQARSAATGTVFSTSAVMHDCTAPPIVVDQGGTVHYTTSGGHQQQVHVRPGNCHHRPRQVTGTAPEISAIHGTARVLKPTSTRPSGA